MVSIYNNAGKRRFIAEYSKIFQKNFEYENEFHFYIDKAGADKIKFAVIYQRYRNLIFHIAATFLSDPRDREEAAQEAFYAIAKNIANLPDPSCTKTKSYIIAVIENKATDIYRKNRRPVTTNMSWSWGYSCVLSSNF